ncbi:uncharacterized protein LOC125269547 isoform X2 [Megalobrama amblycephala]|nr:uncharacterized protein LOC125269547 isoform X2 [Megalobrama amblycephala]XP_048048397.1 uncharacterized protein LOC125269547 isoform X2 [Megalobrama amblycephala]
MEIYEYDLYTAGAEGQDSRPTLDDMMHPNFTTDRTLRSDLQSEEDIYTAGDESPQPSAPLDIAKFIIKVDWSEPFPDRWKATLQKALQSCLLRLEGKPSVHRLKLMDDQSCAEVQITPSTALEVLKKHTPISLKFKDKEGQFKEVAARICLDEALSVTVPGKSMLKENRAPSTKVIGSVHNVEDVAASNRAPNKAETTNTDEMTPETPAGFTLPLYQFWYMHHTYRKELEQFEKQHGVSICAEVSVSIKHIQRSSPDSVSKTTADFQTLVQRCTGSFSDAAINHNDMDSDIVKQALRHIQSEESKMMFTMSASNCLFFGPKKFTDAIKREVEVTRLESQFNNSRPTQNDTKHQNFTMDRLYLQPEEVIGAAGVESPQPSALLDTAKFIIKVDRREPFPDRWRATLQKALQVWLSKMEGKASVHSLELMHDQSCAEVEITPSTALEVLKKHTPISLRFKDKQVTARICPYEARSVTVPRKSMLKKNRAPSTKVIGFVSVTAASEDPNNVEDVAASNRAPNEAEATNTAGLTHETPAVFPLPLSLSWYMQHTYGKELKQIEKQYGVKIYAEVSISINPTEISRSDSVSKASDAFQTLVQRCTDSFSDAAIDHNHMDSDSVKQVLRHIQSEETRMMFTMSANNCLFFGPKKFTDLIKRGVEKTRLQSQFTDKSSQVNVDNNFSPQIRASLDMDIKDLPTQLEMDKVYWDLMKLSYENQLSQLETKYGVTFNAEKQQKNVTIKVQARSNGVQRINLESHAIRALTHLYQKLASAAVTCELKNPKDAAVVASAVEKLQQEHHCVVAADVLSRWRLVGLPEHLGPAIAEIEKILKMSVFDDKMKKSIGYSGDIPHARGIKWNQVK